MIWALILAMAAAVLGFAVLVLKLPRQSMTLFAAALMFGLAGYALQGSPGQPSAPGVVQTDPTGTGEALVEARRTVFDDGQPPARFLVIADAFARKGQFEQAAQMLRGATQEEPNNPEAWTALANALVEHAGGQLTPAALAAYARAEEVGRGHPGPGYFLGVALLRGGRPLEARELWAKMLSSAPADAPWRAELALRLQRLDELIAQIRAAGVTEAAQAGAPR